MESLYFIAIVPHDEIEKEIKGIKEYLFQHFKTSASLRSPAHITLHMPFKWKDSKVPLLHDKLQEFLQDKENFQVVLSGFGAFPPRVIFIDVEENEMLQDFRKQLIKFFRLELKLFNADYKEQPFHPHVTVAFRDLKKNLFLQAFGEFKEKQFMASFLVDHLALLKHNGKEWEIEKDFYFKS